MKKILAVTLVLCLTVTGFLSGCTGGAPSIAPVSPNSDAVSSPNTTTPTDGAAAPEGYGTLRVATSSTIAALNVHTWVSSYDGEAAEYLTGKLYRFFPGIDGKYDFSAEMADGDPVQMDEEGKVFRIKIRQDAKWMDGDIINADDFMYSWKMVLDPVMVNSRGGTMAEDYIKIENAKKYYLQKSKNETVSWDEVGIKKIDDHTVEIKTIEKQNAEEVKTHFSQTWTALVHEKLYEAGMSADRSTTMYGTNTDKIISCGPYQIEQWIKGAEITYKKNPSYVKSNGIYLEKMQVKVVKDASTRMQLFENGEIDYISLSSQDYLKYEEDPRVLTSPASGVAHLCVNSGSEEKAILQDPDFRRALFFAIDRKAIADMSQAVPSNWAVPIKKVGNVATGEKFRDMPASNAYLEPNLGYDPAKAKELFDKSMEKAGLTTLTLTLDYNDSVDDYKMMSEFLQKTLPEVLGKDKFTLKLQGMPFNQLNDKKKNYKTNPNSFELSWSSWDTNTIAPWNGLKVWTASYSNKNEPWSNAEYDALWEKANTGVERFDPELRLELTRQMEKIVLDQAGIVPVVERPSRMLKDDRVILPNEKDGYTPKIGMGWMYAKIVDNV